MGIMNWYRERREAARRERQRRADLDRQRRDLQANILTMLGDDRIPKMDWSPLGLPFKLQKTEHLIYLFPQVGYAEQRVRREIVGRSSGVSVRVMKGVSLRMAGSKGRPVERDEIVDRGTGILGVTDRHLYFNGERSFRIRFDRIVSIEPLADAVGVTRDRASALTEYFTVGREDARFAYELLSVIPSLESPAVAEVEMSESCLLLLPGDIGDYLWEES